MTRDLLQELPCNAAGIQQGMARLTPEQRDLVASVAPRIPSLASVFVQSFPRADMEECVSVAYEAIVEAALRYAGDRHSGASFATFIHIRAWGAMFDVERARRRSRAVAALSPEDTPVLPDLPLVGGTVLVRLQRLRLTRAERALLRALSANARVTGSELAAMAGIAQSTVALRLRRLQHDGYLKGSHADIDLAALGVHTSTVCRRHQHIMHRARRALTSARHSHHRR